MTLDWQLLAVAVVITGAGLYLGRSLWLWLRPKKTACGAGCGCSSRPPANAKDQLIPVNFVLPKSPPSSRNGA